jgi:hypothetical protein
LRRVGANEKSYSLLDTGYVGFIESGHLSEVTFFGSPRVKQSFHRRAARTLNWATKGTTWVNYYPFEARVRHPSARQIFFIFNSRYEAINEYVVDREIVPHQVIEGQVAGLPLRFSKNLMTIGMDAPDRKGMVGAQHAPRSFCGSSNGFPTGSPPPALSGLDNSSKKGDFKKIKKT